MTLVRLSIAKRMNLLICVLGAILLLLWIGFVTWMFRTEAEARREALSHAAGTLMSAVDAQVEQYAVLGRILAASPALARDDLRAFDAEARRTNAAAQDTWILLATIDGQQVLNTRLTSGTPAPQRSPIAMDTQRRALLTGKEQVSDIGMGPVSGEPVLTINLPIIRDGEPCYVLAVAFSPRVFTKFMEGLPEYWLAGIVDRQGNYISRSLDNDVVVGRPASPGWRAIMHQRGIFEFPSREGENILNANAPSQLTGWASAVAVQSAALYEPLWRTLAVVATVGALAMAACLVLVAILARWIKTAMAHLKAAIAELRCRQPIIERMGEPEIDEVIEALDITASELAAHERLRVEHERQMQTAAAELNHRSKNLLMVVSGITAVIGRSAPDVRTFSERLTDRLQALARCQDLLVENNWQEVDLVGVAKSQLAPFAEERIELRGQAVALPANLIQPLSLIFYELATNASKHGSLQTHSGRVELSWIVTPELGRNSVSITWREIGGPTVSEPKRRGFGSAIISAASLRPFNGDLKQNYYPEGLVCSLYIVLPA